MLRVCYAYKGRSRKREKMAKENTWLTTVREHGASVFFQMLVKGCVAHQNLIGTPS